MQNTKEQAAAIEAIARTHLRIETLETRNRDSLDFYDLSIWQLKNALEAAYAAGVAAASK